MGAKKSISNSFTVNTVEDGATLTAKSAIHSVGIRCTSDGKSDGSGSSAGMVTLYVDGVAVPTTYLSIKSQPSGLTVLTHTQQSVIPEGGFSISWANNVDRANLEGEVVLTVSYNSYSTEFSIPIICAKDGENGDDGKTYALKLTLPSLVIPCDSSGNSKSSGNKDCYVTFYVDGTAISTSSMTITILSKPSGLTVQTNADVSQISKNRIYITYGSNVAKSTLEGVITFSVSDGTNTTYGGIAVMCSQDGSQGERGKIGRFFYFGGTFNAADTTQTFIVNDAQAPYFEHSETVTTQSGTTTIKRYHVFNYDTNGTYTMAQMWAIRNNWNYKPWESMTNDFKYLITEAIFGSYAHFGSSIINGDWLLSQHGTINGGASTNYQAFDPSHPNDNTGSNFIPNYCVDLLLGKSYQNDAVIRGTIMADNLYHGVCFMSVRGNNNSVFFCNTEVRDGEGQLMRPSFYTFNEAWSASSWYINHLFEEGKYYTAEEIRSISNNDINEGNGGFTECSGYCDTVYVLPTVDNRYPKVFLPRPEDVQGKCVDVFAFQYGTDSPATFYVSCCNLIKGMTGLIYYDSKWRADQSTPAQISCKTNVCMRFMSTKVVETSGSVSTDVWYWLAAPYYK